MESMKKILDEYSSKRLHEGDFAKIHYATLISLYPLDFMLNDDNKIHLKEEYLVVPKYRPFVESDVGKRFVFVSNHGGQTYFYLYEASDPQGSNGIKYKHKKHINDSKINISKINVSKINVSKINKSKIKMSKINDGVLSGVIAIDGDTKNFEIKNLKGIIPDMDITDMDITDMDITDMDVKDIDHLYKLKD